MIGLNSQTNFHDMWKKDVNKRKGEFSNTSVCELQLHTETTLPTVIDDANAIEATNKALVKIKQIPDKTRLRLILLGPGFHEFIFKVIKQLLDEWKTPDGEKRRFQQFNFTISNTTTEREFFDFCRKLCISGVCQSVHFYNTDYQRPHGHYNKTCA
jgi:hypothetical protein